MGSASYTKGAKRAGGNHEWTRMARMGNSEPRMDTNGHERKTQNHEWTRMDTNGKFRATNGHEWEIQSHEWTRNTRKGSSEPRMDTKGANGTTKYRSGTTKHTKNTKKGRGDSMNHERHELIV